MKNKKPFHEKILLGIESWAKKASNSIAEKDLKQLGDYLKNLDLPEGVNKTDISNEIRNIAKELPKLSKKLKQLNLLANEIESSSIMATLIDLFVTKEKFVITKKDNSKIVFTGDSLDIFANPITWINNKQKEVFIYFSEIQNISTASKKEFKFS
ncbi:MAG: hypothetical protein KAR54_01910 [Candidatus Pacebacteria bacterium]|nr:hypothetical protein [Candidatus Paceibacterota bacterium]